MTNSEKPDLESLQEFQKEFDDKDSDLHRLEKLLNKFNVFDVLNIVTAETSHSNVLAWLLNPNESHNIGDKALKLFLESIHRGESSKSGVDLTSLINDSSKIDRVEIRTEEYIFQRQEPRRKKDTRRIDISILIKSGSKKFLIIIENKIGAKDTTRQLVDYRNWAENKFKEDYKKIFIYLTPERVVPNDKNELPHWDLFSYEQIERDILNKVIQKTPKGNAKEFIKQYVDILRRIILGNSNKLCNDIYDKHEKVINLIYKEVIVKKFIDQYVKDKIEEDKNFEVVDFDSKKYIQFTTKTLSEKIKIQREKGDKPILLFQFVSNSNRLALTLGLGQGDDVNQLLSFMEREKEIFTFPKEKKGWKTKVIFSMPILGTKDYDHEDMVEKIVGSLTKKIEKKWPSVEAEIQKIDEVFNNKWPNFV